MCRPRRSQLKTAGTQKVFPLSPLRTPLTPSPKNKECYFSLGGTGGTLFAQHYSCPAVLRCSVGLTMAAFFGNSFWYVINCCLNRAAHRGLHSIGKAALLSRRSRSRTRTSRVRSLLVAQTEQLEAELAPRFPIHYRQNILYLKYGCKRYNRKESRSFQ